VTRRTTGISIGPRRSGFRTSWTIFISATTRGLITSEITSRYTTNLLVDQKRSYDQKSQEVQKVVGKRTQIR